MGTHDCFHIVNPQIDREMEAREREGSALTRLKSQIASTAFCKRCGYTQYKACSMNRVSNEAIVATAPPRNQSKSFTLVVFFEGVGVRGAIY